MVFAWRQLAGLFSVHDTCWIIRESGARCWGMCINSFCALIASAKRRYPALASCSMDTAREGLTPRRDAPKNRKGRAGQWQPGVTRSTYVRGMSLVRTHGIDQDAGTGSGGH